MVSIIEFRIPLDRFALATTFEAVAELDVEAERFAVQATNSVIPFVRVETDDFEAFERALAVDPSVEAASCIADYGDERLYRMEWGDDVGFVLDLLLEEDGAITALRTGGEAWEFRLMCPEHHSLSEIYAFCEENGLTLSVDAIYEPDSSDGSEHGLTDSQHASLVKAKEMGYYDVPREVSLSDLSDALGVSHQALSERLRRGHGRLIERTLRSYDDRTNGPIRPEQ
ncbi:HTH DNA binding domain protein [Halalkalicoccus paucihalophilus]|uniref:HTH DNA binding domain protein n=1 Tax=Halalkalicoccus paucihalophilus TaxID=1008153 RepID=A0A151AG09_9EURY|nr:helix-turn-helix domain-containing protein [Halalkalicoccus paucihalophilus]KYH26492.1 HTH DNA binding domain protein [Halalkalicoccus paucihalophilus]